MGTASCLSHTPIMQGYYARTLVRERISICSAGPDLVQYPIVKHEWKTRRDFAIQAARSLVAPVVVALDTAVRQQHRRLVGCSMCCLRRNWTKGYPIDSSSPNM